MQQTKRTTALVADVYRAPSEGLVASDVTVTFGGLTALSEVSIDAPVGRITGLIGPNGAGKTTMFNVCSGFLAPDTGTVSLCGEDVTSRTVDQRARQGVGRTFQRMELFGSLTVRENVELAAEAAHVRQGPLSQLGIVGAGRSERRRWRQAAAAVIERVGIGDLANVTAGELSTGQGRLVELARALARGPQVLLLDEPSSGLDVAESEAFGDLLLGLVGEGGLGILLVEHDMQLVLRICSWIHVLDFGRKLFEGAPDEVRNSPEVQAVYLGHDPAG